MTSRRSFIGFGALMATAVVVRTAAAQPRKPAITVYRDPT
jgi:hypothetical protein